MRTVWFLVSPPPARPSPSVGERDPRGTVVPSCDARGLCTRPPASGLRERAEGAAGSRRVCSVSGAAGATPPSGVTPALAALPTRGSGQRTRGQCGSADGACAGVAERVGGVSAEALEPVGDHQHAGAPGCAGAALAEDGVAGWPQSGGKVANLGEVADRADELRLAQTTPFRDFVAERSGGAHCHQMSPPSAAAAVVTDAESQPGAGSDRGKSGLPKRHWASTAAAPRRPLASHSRRGSIIAAQ